MKLKINLPTVFLLIDIKNGLEKRDQKIVTIPIPLINGGCKLNCVSKD